MNAKFKSLWLRSPLPNRYPPVILEANFLPGGGSENKALMLKGFNFFVVMGLLADLITLVLGTEVFCGDESMIFP